MRIPRKKKKMYKLLWEKRLGYKITFVKKSIHKDRVWECMVNKKKNYEKTRSN